MNLKDMLDFLLKQEDTTKSNTITIEDLGLKRFVFPGENGDVLIEGTYHLSNLLQELALAIESNKDTILLDAIFEKPTHRLSRLIREVYWDRLTRKIDKEGLEKVIFDEKIKQDIFYIYIPFNDQKAFEYYKEVSREFSRLKTIQLPEKITPEFVLSIREKPGLLSLALFEEEGELQGHPFVVPGGRFNEMYGWDSYFESVGLLLDKKNNLVAGMLENFEYQIKHYGKILNANRSYFLTRTQPPFFSSMIREFYEETDEAGIEWLREKLSTAIEEYEKVWMQKDVRLCSNGLNRYFAEGIGYVFETEEGHFKEVLEKYAKEHKMPVAEFEIKYKNREIKVPDLEEYFLHDRSLRESGHDTSNRLIEKCAYLNTVDLNALLYKCEKDFSELIQTYFEGSFVSRSNKTYTDVYWFEVSEKRKENVNKLLWNEKEELYFDYNFKNQEQTNFISATTFYPLWAKLCTQEQANLLVKKALPLLKCKGGIVSCTEESRGVVNQKNPNRQWDYPFGWAPHQMLVWKGLQQYGFYDEVQELVYRWLWVITKEAVNYNGTITEKYDVVNCTHKIKTEYGNVGETFKYIPDGGFGWMNGSYQLGISILNKDAIEKLDNLIDPDILFQ
jgi:alpha,alpha-trehalase